MNSREVFNSRLAMEGSDTVPFFPRDLTLGMDALNVPTTDIFHEGYNAELSAKCVLELQKRIGHDAVVGCINYYGLEAFGGVTKYPKDGIPYHSKAAFDNIENILQHDPSEIRDKRLDGIRDSYALVRKARPDLAVVMNISGPMNTAANLRGVENFIMDTTVNPDVAQTVMDFAANTMWEMIDHMNLESCDCVFFASASDNPDMVGPEEFARFSLPKIKWLTDRIHKEGKRTIFHPHGIFSTDDRRELLKKCLDTGVDGFQFAENNVPEGILRETKGRCCILGGVDCFTTLILGNPERIKRDANQFLELLGNEDYIMTCSCSLNRGIPIDAVKTLGEYIRKWKR